MHMNEFIFSKRRILLLGSGELGKELVIESKRLGLEVIAIDKYENAPAMQVADYSYVIDMSNKEILSKTIKDVNLLDEKGAIILHRHKNDKITLPEKYEIIEERKYGISRIFFLNYSN